MTRMKDNAVDSSDGSDGSNGSNVVYERLDPWSASNLLLLMQNLRNQINETQG